MHGVRYKHRFGEEDWTPVKRRRRRSHSAESDDMFIPKGASVVYVEGGGTPGLAIRTRNSKSWVPISTRTRSKLKI